MKVQEGTLGSFTATGAGTAQNISQLEKVRVHVSGTFVGTVATEISFDLGVTWAVFDTSTAPELIAELPPVGRVRANVTAFTSGTIVVNFGGQNPDRMD